MTAAATGSKALFDEPLTVTEVLEHFEAAVGEYGADYRDSSKAANRVCLYLYEDRANRAGNACRCAIGEIVWRARGVQIRPRDDAVSLLLTDGSVPVEPVGPRHGWDAPTGRLLTFIQTQQDAGFTWGEILDEAKGRWPS